VPVEFFAEPNPSPALCRELTALAPANPFYTSSYIEAQRALVSEPWILSLRRDGELVVACPAFIKSGMLNRSLEIPSLPEATDPEEFWRGVLGFCRHMKVSRMAVNSFGSPRAIIPLLRGEVARTARSEYVLDLRQPDFQKGFSSHHTRNIKRGRHAGLWLRRAVDEQAVQEHAWLVSASMRRREDQGKMVPSDVHRETFAAMARNGAGELFQAVHDGKVFSSVLVLRAEKGAYYQSAGTSPEGMACGASHFLVNEIASALQREGAELFNLGGASEDESGLARFKSGFGGTRVELEAAEFYLGSPIRKRLGSLSAFLRGILNLKSLSSKATALRGHGGIRL